MKQNKDYLLHYYSAQSVSSSSESAPSWPLCALVIHFSLFQPAGVMNPGCWISLSCFLCSLLGVALLAASAFILLHIPLSLSHYPYPFILMPLSLSLYRYPFIPIPLSLSLYPYPFIPLYLSLYPYIFIIIPLSLYLYPFIPIPLSLWTYPFIHIP